MSLFVCSLNSGSNGNCYYIGNNREAVLIDAGISCREAEKRMKILGLSINKVKAVFISHEHTDHTKGAPALAQRFSIPIYITKNTLKSCPLIIPASTIPLFSCKPVTIGDLSITAIPKQHDAEDPQNFTVSCNKVTVGVFTDMG
ncbi:MAG: MBL fold metallo-hydrolase, partial [Ferruginibacter sp.]